MIHYGDITKINGHEVPIVDVVTGGSPCQDLSVAGKRAGLDGERSGLFMEQIRIIKEMRNEYTKQLSMRGADVNVCGIKPRFMVWENVQGAFSSGNPKGEDFRIVLEETARIADSNAVIPKPPNRKWTHSGCILGNGWSIAWRLHDAQFWGVPQRRKRIALVADFGGTSAPEILFERKGVSGNTTESGEQGQGTSTDTERSVDKASTILMDAYQHHGYRQSVTCGTLTVDQNQGIRGDTPLVVDKATVYGISSYDSNSMKSSNPHSGIYEADTSRTLDLNGGNPACNQGGMMVAQGADMYNQTTTGDKTMSITGAATDSHHIPCVVLEGNGSRPSHKGDGYSESDVSYTLNSTEQHAVCLENHMENQTYQNVTGTLDCEIARGTSNQLANQDMFVANQSVVRRLTPLECERLQGFPDNWTNIGEWTDTKGKKRQCTDGNRHKALGNSIALPYWSWLAERMVKVLRTDGIENPTMASLFDGIGGFPLAFSTFGVHPVWASEIEEFPIAVTKLRFSEDEDNLIVEEISEKEAAKNEQKGEE